MLKEAELEFCAQHGTHEAVQFRRGDEAVREGFCHALFVHRSAFHIHPGCRGKGSCFRGGAGDAVLVDEVLRPATVGNDEAVEAPFLPQDALE